MDGLAVTSEGGGYASLVARAEPDHAARLDQDGPLVASTPVLMRREPSGPCRTAAHDGFGQQSRRAAEALAVLGEECVA